MWSRGGICSIRWEKKLTVLSGHLDFALIVASSMPVCGLKPVSLKHCSMCNVACGLPYNKFDNSLLVNFNTTMGLQ